MKTRNGALEFAVFSPELRASVESYWIWQNGMSSPWVQDYKIIPIARETSETEHFEVEFTMATSESINLVSYNITVQKFNDHWFVSNFQQI